MKDLISFRQLLSLLFAGAFLASCAPYPPEGPYAVHIPNAERVDSAELEVDEMFTSEIQKQKEANRKRLVEKRERDAAARHKKQTQPAANSNIPEIVKKKEEAAPVQKKSKYPTAKRSREGFVINPYTGNEVDVRGVPGRSLVFDPDDPNKATNRFRVP